MRSAKLSRKTGETSIHVELLLDGTGSSKIKTGIGFFDHMLTSFAKHSGFDLYIDATGDLEVDEHHLVEDTGIVLGQAILKALGDKTGIARFGEARVPMDESLSEVALDLGGRSYMVMNVSFSSGRVGDFNTQMVEHFFESIVEHGKINLHASVYGKNDHHMIESLFKAFACAMHRAVRIEGKGIRSTKGVL